MAKKVTGFGDNAALDIALIGGAVVALYFVGKSVIDGLSGNDSVFSAQMALPVQQNPFNYQFQPFNDFYNQNTPTIQNSSGWWGGIESYLGIAPNVTQIDSPTIQQFFIALKASPPASSPWGLLDVVTLSQLAEKIYSSTDVSWWNPFSTTDQTAASSAVSGFTNQLQVAFVANYLWWNYNVDMLTYLRGSLTKAGLNQANLDQLINNVNSLPINPTV